MVSPEMDSSSKETRVTAVQKPNEPDPEGVLAKVLSRTTTRISVDPEPPPDGGLMAWTQVACGHLIIFNTWGYIVSYGVFQTYYVVTLGHPPSDISWVCISRKSSQNTWRVTKYGSLTVGRPAKQETHANFDPYTGRISPNLSALFCRNILWTSYRLRSLSTYLPRWLNPAANRCLHDFFKH